MTVWCAHRTVIYTECLWIVDFNIGMKLDLVVTYTRCRIDTINSPDDEHMAARNM